MVTRCIPNIHDPRTEARGSLRRIYMRCKRLMAKVGGSYIRRIHQVTMIHGSFFVQSVDMAAQRSFCADNG